MVANPPNFQVQYFGLKENQEFLSEIGNILVKGDDQSKFEKLVKTLCQKVWK